MSTLTVQLPQLHTGQKEVAGDPARFKVLACGRRRHWGKTRLGALLCVVTGLSKGRAWWVAPSYPMASIGWRLVKRLAGQIPGTVKHEADRAVDFPGGGVVQVKSADNPDSLRGEGLDFLVMDECAFIQEAAWTEALRATLSDRQGKALFISTPKGRNWFWRAWLAGQNGGEWRSWQFPTVSNPYIKASEVEAARGMLPERIFAQEYLAEFLDDDSGVFRRVLDAATATERNGAGEYVVGVDWGKHNDFTALTVMDVAQQSMVHLDRFNQIDYATQVGRLKALCEKYSPVSLMVERNSMGEPLIEQLQREGLPVQPFTTTNATKAVIIDALALAFERGDIRILPDPVLISELQAYETERLPSGMLRYSAPEGMHDDTVISLALAWYGALRSNPPAGDTLTIPDDVYTGGGVYGSN